MSARSAADWRLRRRCLAPECGLIFTDDAAHEIECRAGEVWMRKRAIDTLHAFGRAIAAVARAQLIAHAAIGRTIRVDMDEPNAERGLELWQRGASLCLSEYAPNRTPRRLWQIEGQPEDIAAEAVARLLAEVGL